jgi:LIM domain
MGFSVQRRGTVSGVMTTSGNRNNAGQALGNVSNGRPLPASPEPLDYASEGPISLLNSGGDDRSEDRTPSPQYGILDMPRSRFANRVEVKPEQRAAKGAGKAPLRPNTAPQQAPTQSLTLQMASMSLAGNDNTRSAKSPASPSNNWPANLPPLPRAPRSPARRGMIDLDDAPPPSLRRSPSLSKRDAQSRSASIPSLPTIRPQNTTPQRTTIPKISFPADPREPDSDSDEDNNGPMISISVADTNTPRMSASPAFSQVPKISVGSRLPASGPAKPSAPPSFSPLRRNGLTCGGCGGAIIGRVVSAINVRWHPGCFKCSVCNELLENLSSYEKDGKPYCHLDYHEVSVRIKIPPQRI